jgi:hypothetical protein
MEPADPVDGNDLFRFKGSHHDSHGPGRHVPGGENQDRRERLRRVVNFIHFSKIEDAWLVISEFQGVTNKY